MLSLWITPTLIPGSRVKNTNRWVRIPSRRDHAIILHTWLPKSLEIVCESNRSRTLRLMHLAQITSSNTPRLEHFMSLLNKLEIHHQARSSVSFSHVNTSLIQGHKVDSMSPRVTQGLWCFDHQVWLCRLRTIHFEFLSAASIRCHRSESIVRMFDIFFNPGCPFRCNLFLYLCLNLTSQALLCAPLMDGLQNSSESLRFDTIEHD